MLPEDQDGSRKFKKGRPGHLPTELNVIYFDLMDQFHEPTNLE